MKCVQNAETGRILKVSNVVAKELVRNGYQYVEREAYRIQAKHQRSGIQENKSVEEHRNG